MTDKSNPISVPKNTRIAGFFFLCFILALYICNLLKPMPGTDDGVTGIICAIEPGYRPWAARLRLVPGSLAETLLFGLQILLGIALFAYCFSLLRKKSKTHNPV